MVWGGFGHMAVVLFFPAVGIRLKIFQDYDMLGNSLLIILAVFSHWMIGMSVKYLF